MPIRGPGTSSTVTAPAGIIKAKFYLKVTVEVWFADVSTVKLLFGPETISSTILKEEVILAGTEEKSLKFTNIKENSETVADVQTTLAPDSKTITAYTATSLTNAPIVKGKIKVYNDGDEDAVKIEGTDYTINYEKGQITLETPDFTAGAAVATSVTGDTANASFYCKTTVKWVIAVHYEYYNILTRDTDYTINYTTGKIARITSGNITDGDKVFVDYKTSITITDQMIELAIDMTHESLLDRVGSSYQGSTNKKLRYAEANLAASFLTKLVMSKVINEGLAGSPLVHQITRNIKRIEDSFKSAGESFLSGFISFGVTSAGDIKQNAIFNTTGVL